MKYSLKTIELFCFFTTCILGILFHFMYGWCAEHPVAGLVFPVNESTWEHLKLIFFPISFVSVLEYIFFRNKFKHFICTKFVSILIGMAITVVCFYTYIGIYGKNSEAMNMFIYFLSIGAATLFSYRIQRDGKLAGLSTRMCYLGFAALTLLFFVFTIFPPPIGLFATPV